MVHTATDKATHDSLTNYIQKNPVQAAAMAFAAGIVVSALLRRN